MVYSSLEIHIKTNCVRDKDPPNIGDRGFGEYFGKDKDFWSRKLAFSKHIPIGKDKPLGFGDWGKNFLKKYPAMALAMSVNLRLILDLQGGTLRT